MGTGADYMVLSDQQWPKGWKTELTSSIWDVGGVQKADQSATWLQVGAPDPFNPIAVIKPLALPTLVTLWGWNILQLLGAKEQLKFHNAKNCSAPSMANHHPRLGRAMATTLHQLVQE